MVKFGEHGEIWRTWRDLENMEKFGEHGEIGEHGECLALYHDKIGEHGECLALYRRDVWGILSKDSCARLGIWASPWSHCHLLMTQGATANAHLGPKSRTRLLLDNAKENVTGRR